MHEKLSEMLLPGCSIVIERAPGRPAGKAESRIVGLFQEKYILVELPMLGGRSFLTHWDSQCIVRFVLEGQVVGFRARVASLQTSPLPIAALEYPRDIERVVVRKQERILCAWEAILTLNPADGSDSAGDKGATAPNPKANTAQAQAPHTVADSTEGAEAATPFQALVADISDGGCYTVLPLFDKGVGKSVLPQTRKSIPSSLHAYYKSDFLLSSFAVGRGVTLEVNVAPPSNRRFGGVNCLVRWREILAEHFGVGLRFEHPPADFVAAVKENITFHNTYYRQPEGIS